MRIPIFLLIVTCAHSAWAQPGYAPEHREYEFTGFLGASVIGKYRLPTLVTADDGTTRRNVEMKYASGYQFGIRGSKNIDDYWSVHLEYSFANQPLVFTNLTPTVPSLSLSHLVHRLHYDVAYLPAPPSKRFRPYAQAGVGTGLFYITGDSKDEARSVGVNLRDSWEFVFNWGGGFTHVLQDQVALTFSIKDQMSAIPSYGLPHMAQIRNGQYQPGVARDGLMHNWQLNLGIAFQWDE